VIGGLREHTKAANSKIREVPIAEGPELAERVNSVVGRQVAVLDLLLDVDCGEDRSQQCVGLTDTRAASAQLQQTANQIAMAGEQVGAADPTLHPAQVTGAPVAAASSNPAGATASEEPTAAASPASSASPSPTPSATEDAGGADGEATPAYAGTQSDSTSSGGSSTTESPTGSESTLDGASDATTAVVDPLVDAADEVGDLP
jgi:hypothetical protein